MIFKIVTSCLLIVAIVCFLKLTPEQLANDVVLLLNKKESIRDKVHSLRAGKKKDNLGSKLIYIQNALKSMDKENKFALVICASLVLTVVGVVVAIILNNVLLIPTFAIGFAIIPFVYIQNSMESYHKHIKDELETTLSIITTSYCRNGDIIAAVKENLSYIKPPLRVHFSAFVGDASIISNTKQAIKNLKKKVDDDIFKEWCDALIQCQDENTLKDTLHPIVSKFTDIRLVNSEVSSIMASARMEYYTMVGLVVGNIPLLYVLNKDWFNTLVYELPGKITLGICGVVILVTYLFLNKFTKPIEYEG